MTWTSKGLAVSARSLVSMGEWESGNLPYAANSLVKQNGWHGVAKVQTSEHLEPIRTGDLSYEYQGTIGTNQVTVKQVIAGQRYKFSQPIFIDGYRVFTVIGNEYKIYTVTEPNGANELKEVLTFVANKAGWIDASIVPRLIAPGVEFDVLVVTSEPAAAPVVTSLSYNYLTPNRDSAPDSGEIIHPNRSLTTFNISKVDSNAVDQTAFLSTLTIGDTISGAGVKWSIQEVDVSLGHFTFTVAPAQQGTPDGLYTFDFEIITATPITYGFDSLYWQSTGNSAVKGLFTTGALADLVVSDDAFGIDILKQDAIFSDDWEIYGSSENATGASISGSSVENVTIGTFNTIDTQVPTGLGQAGAITVHFGVGGTTNDNEFTVASDGVITCNKNTIQYTFNVIFRFRRTGNPGVTNVVARMMYAADGINFSQLGNTFGAEVDNPRTTWREEFNLQISPAVGSKIFFELARDPAETNAGEIGTFQPTGDLSAWNQVNSASLNIVKTQVQ